MRPRGQPAEEETESGVGWLQQGFRMRLSWRSRTRSCSGPGQRASHFQEGRASGQVRKPRCRETDSCLQALRVLTAWPETGGAPRRPARGASRLGHSRA